MKYKSNYKSAVYCKEMMSVIMKCLIQNFNDVDESLGRMESTNNEDERKIINNKIKTSIFSIDQLSRSINDMTSEFRSPVIDDEAEENKTPDVVDSMDLRTKLRQNIDRIQQLYDEIKDDLPAVYCNGVKYATIDEFEANNPNCAPYYNGERYTAIRECLEENHDGTLDLDEEADPIQCFEAIGNKDHGTPSFGCSRIFAYHTEVYLSDGDNRFFIDLANCPEMVWESVEEALEMNK